MQAHAINESIRQHRLKATIRLYLTALPLAVSDKYFLVLLRRTRTVLFCVCNVSLQSFDIMPLKSFLSMIIIIIIIIQSHKLQGETDFNSDRHRKHSIASTAGLAVLYIGHSK